MNFFAYEMELVSKFCALSWKSVSTSLLSSIGLTHSTYLKVPMLESLCLYQHACPRHFACLGIAGVGHHCFEHCCLGIAGVTHNCFRHCCLSLAGVGHTYLIHCCLKYVSIRHFCHNPDQHARIDNIHFVCDKIATFQHPSLRRKRKKNHNFNVYLQKLLKSLKRECKV